MWWWCHGMDSNPRNLPASPGPNGPHTPMDEDHGEFPHRKVAGMRQSALSFRYKPSDGAPLYRAGPHGHAPGETQKQQAKIYYVVGACVVPNDFFRLFLFVLLLPARACCCCCCCRRRCSCCCCRLWLLLVRLLLLLSLLLLVLMIQVHSRGRAT